MKLADVPVAQYLRMSTEHQQYSLEMQSAAIVIYAQERGYKIVKTYSDAAKSGVLFRGRGALQSLIEDVVRGIAAFKAILVYDVSRWGRFQDTDEAAHYEFLCKSAGIPVHYCAETFTNDGGLPSLIMKSLKRVMAGEYSRELGVKVSAGQRRLVQRGFRQGGPPRYALRRMLVSADGKPKQRLANGERKSIATDRVVLIPGPLREVRCVKRIYRLFIKKGLTYTNIARQLNNCGIRYVGGSEWNERDVKVILTHPKYAGFNVYGCSTQRLYTPLVRVPRSEWIVIPNAFPALVSQEAFAEAQCIVDRYLRSCPRHRSDEDLLAILRAILAREGKITIELMRKTKDCPSPATFSHRFGSLCRAYEMIGYSGFWNGGWLGKRRDIQVLRNTLMIEISNCSLGSISIDAPGHPNRTRLRLSDGNLISLLGCRCFRAYKGNLRWVVKSVPDECHLITLIARLNENNTAFKDFFLIPPIRALVATILAEKDPRLAQAIPLSNLSNLSDSVRTLLNQKGQTWPTRLFLLQGHRKL